MKILGAADEIAESSGNGRRSIVCLFHGTCRIEWDRTGCDYRRVSRVDSAINPLAGFELERHARCIALDFPGDCFARDRPRHPRGLIAEPTAARREVRVSSRDEGGAQKEGEETRNSFHVPRRSDVFL